MVPPFIEANVINPEDTWTIRPAGILSSQVESDVILIGVVLFSLHIGGDSYLYLCFSYTNLWDYRER